MNHGSLIANGTRVLLISHGDHYLMVTSDVFSNATTTETDVEDRPIKNTQKSGAKSGAVSSRKEQNQAETGALGADSGALENDSLNEKTQVNPGNLLVVRGGLEPPTHGFSVRCSTN